MHIYGDRIPFNGNFTDPSQTAIELLGNHIPHRGASLDAYDARNTVAHVEKLSVKPGTIADTVKSPEDLSLAKMRASFDADDPDEKIRLLLEYTNMVEDQSSGVESDSDRAIRWMQDPTDFVAEMLHRSGIVLEGVEAMSKSGPAFYSEHSLYFATGPTDKADQFTKVSWLSPNGDYSPERPEGMSRRAWVMYRAMRSQHESPILRLMSYAMPEKGERVIAHGYSLNSEGQLIEVSGAADGVVGTVNGSNVSPYVKIPELSIVPTYDGNKRLKKPNNIAQVPIGSSDPAVSRFVDLLADINPDNYVLGLRVPTLQTRKALESSAPMLSHEAVRGVDHLTRELVKQCNPGRILIGQPY